MENIYVFLVSIPICLSITYTFFNMANTVEFDERQEPTDIEKETINTIDTNTKLLNWRIGNSVVIYPHIKIDALFTFEEILLLVNNIKDTVFGDDMIIYETNNYCHEVNGRWNVCFGIYDNMGYTYTYMIRRDYLTKETYGCPFRNIEYEADLKHTEFSNEKIPEKFIQLENFLKSTYNGTNITSFRKV